MLVPPVGRGVERAEGISEVKMVADDGATVYFEDRTERSAGVKPGAALTRVDSFASSLLM